MRLHHMDFNKVVERSAEFHKTLLFFEQLLPSSDGIDFFCLLLQGNPLKIVCKFKHFWCMALG